jgi:hypothetical protein
MPQLDDILCHKWPRLEFLESIVFGANQKNGPILFIWREPKKRAVFLAYAARTATTANATPVTISKEISIIPISIYF